MNFENQAPSSLPVQIWLCMDMLSRDLQPKYLYDHLKQDDVISVTDVEKVDHCVTSVAKARCLLTIIITKSTDKIQSFMDALEETYPFLRRMIDDSQVTDQNTSDFLGYISRLERADVLNVVDGSLYRRRIKKHDIQNSLRHHLRKVYQNRLMWIYPVPWNNDVRVKTTDIYSDSWFSNASSLSRFRMSEDNVYEKLSLIGSGDVKRILFEGEPGAGKSTFCQQLVLDWASNPEGSLAQRFDLILYFPANTLTDYLPLSVKENILPDDVDISMAELGSVLLDPAIQKKILVVADGYDELNETKYVDEIWNSQKLHECYMLVTSRSGFPARNTKAIDEKYILLGLTDEGVRHYISGYAKYFVCSRSVEDGVKAFSGVLLREMRRNPLCLSLLALVIDDSAVDDMVPSSKTQLFSEVVDLCIERGTEKLKSKLKEEYDQTLIDRSLSDLWKISFDSLINVDDYCHFPWTYEDPPAVILCTMGLLVHVKGQKKLRPTVRVDFVHKVFQEFFAAKYLKECTHEELDKHFTSIDVFQHQNIIIFLSGLLGADDTKLRMFYQRVATLIAPLIDKVMFKNMYGERWLGKHSPTHLLAECVGESGNTCALDAKMIDKLPNRISCSARCMTCIKGLSLARSRFDVPCAIGITDKSLDHIIPMENLNRFVVRSESAICRLLEAVFKNFNHVQHLFVYLDGPQDGSTNDVCTSPLEFLCRTRSEHIKTLVWNYSCAFSKRYDDSPKYFVEIMLYLIGPALTHISLHGCRLDSVHIQRLADGLNRYQTVETLQISGCRFEMPVARSSMILKNLKNINIEYLIGSSENKYYDIMKQDTSGTEVPEFLYLLLKKGNLQSIHVRHQNIGSGSQFEKGLLENKHTLKVLSLHNVKLDYPMFTSRVFRKSLSSRHLRQVCLNNCTTMKDVSILVKSMTHVESLDLSLNPIHEEKDLRKVVDGLAILPNLKELFLEGCGITDQMLHWLAPLLRSRVLCTLSLAQNDLLTSFDDMGVLESVFATPSTLKHLFISLKTYCANSAVLLATIWKRHENLERINIVTNHPSSQDTIGEIHRILGPSITYKEITLFHFPLNKAGNLNHLYLRDFVCADQQRSLNCYESFKVYHM